MDQVRREMDEEKLKRKFEEEIRQRIKRENQERQERKRIANEF
jgi:hypothetical protein